MPKFVVQPQDHCRQTALFLWWFNPGISIVVILVLFYCLFPPLLTAAHHSLQSQLRELVDGKKHKPSDESAKTSSTRSDKDMKAIPTATESESEDARRDATSSDADAVIVDSPSSNNQRTEAVSASQRKDNADTSSTSSPKTAPDHIRQLSHIFVQHTLLTFVIQPLLIFLGCLFVNNANFCDRHGNSRYPSGLWNMLWVLLPGYLLWGWSVVAAWGETASAVMGWHDREKPADMSYLQVVLMFVVLPVPMVLILLVGLVYSGLVELVAKGIERRDRNAAGKQKHEGKTGDAVEGDKKNL